MPKLLPPALPEGSMPGKFVVRDGVKYVSKYAGERPGGFPTLAGCDGCAADNDGNLCKNLPICHGQVGDEYKDIIWVRKE